VRVPGRERGAARVLAPSRAPGAGGPGRSMPGWARGVCGIAVFLLAAEALGRAGVINQAVLPLASTVLARAAGLAVSPQFLGDVAATIGAWALGLAIAVAIAVPAGVVLGSLPGVRAATRAIVEFLRPIPSIALIVLVGLVIGAGIEMNVILIVYAAIWPVMINTIYGLDDVDPVARETLRAFGFGRISVITLVDLPSASPYIATGIRLASAIAIILNISTGFLTGRISGYGIGTYIAEANTGAGNVPLMLAAAVWAGMLGLAANAVLVWGERRVLRWHHAYSLEPV
jgi:NitT/TauT family transport system permease protein